MAVTMHTPLQVPVELDLQLFWPPDSRGRLFGPLDLAHPCHRDILWTEIERSIECSDIWMDVLEQRNKRGEYEMPVYIEMKAKAEELLDYKRGCLRVLEEMDGAR